MLHLHLLPASVPAASGRFTGPRAWLLAIVASMMLWAPGARAAPVLDVGGTGNGGYAIADGQAIGISFQLNGTLSSFSLSAPLTCLVGRCNGSVWLQRTSLGPGTMAQTLFADTLSSVFSGGSIHLSSSTLGLDATPLGSLDADLYLLLVALDDDRNPATPTQSLLWTGSTTPVVSQSPAPPHALASRGLEYQTTGPPALNPWVPLSNFQAIASNSPNLHFTLSSVEAPPPTQLPEPSGLALVLAALGLGALARRGSG